MFNFILTLLLFFLQAVKSVTWRYRNLSLFIHHYYCLFFLQAFTVLQGVHANELTVEIRNDGSILGMSPMLIITIVGKLRFIDVTWRVTTVTNSLTGKLTLR